MRCCRISLYISEKYIGVGTGSRNYRHSAMDAFFFLFFLVDQIIYVYLFWIHAIMGILVRMVMGTYQNNMNVFMEDPFSLNRKILL